VQFDSPVEQRQRLAYTRLGPLAKGCQAAQVIVIGVEALGRLPSDALDLGLLQLRSNGSHHARSHLVLQVKYVFQSTIEAARPQMRRCRGIDELPGDAHLGTRLADAALEHIPHTQFAAHLPYVHGATLVSEARIACDHEQPVHARQRRDDLLHHAVREVFLFRIAADVYEWQHCNRRLVRQQRGISGPQCRWDAIRWIRRCNAIGVHWLWYVVEPLLADVSVGIGELPLHLIVDIAPDADTSG